MTTSGFESQRLRSWKEGTSNPMGVPSSVLGGESPVQASAEDLMDLSGDFGFNSGAGAPTLLASGVAFEPLHVLPTLMGNSEADDVTSDEGAPAQLCVKYIGHGGRLVVRKVPYVAGMSVHYYLKRTRTNSVRTTHALLCGSRRVRLNYVPQVGEHITLNRKDTPYMQLGESNDHRQR